ncbi:unnamed protein product [Tenebrio molitor]|nr:unnamed protein product [Tenebrio molitor]
MEENEFAGPVFACSDTAQMRITVDDVCHRHLPQDIFFRGFGYSQKKSIEIPE